MQTSYLIEVFNGVSGSFKEVSRKFRECLKKVSRVFQYSFKVISRKFKGYSKKVFRMLQGRFKGVPMEFYVGFKDF